MSIEYAVEIRNLIKKYPGNCALKCVNAKIPSGAVVGLLGPNGAGKSSLLKILAGLTTGTFGDVIVNGISLADNAKKAKQHVSFMPENNPLPDCLRVNEYLRFRASMKNIPSRQIRTATEKVMRQCDIYNDATRYKMIKTLSKGCRQRVGLADAMLGPANIVILDEPTIGLDPSQICNVRNIISEIRGSRTVIISSHILSELETLCDYFIILNQGELVTCGTLHELIKTHMQENKHIISLQGSQQDINDIFHQLNIVQVICHVTENIYDVTFSATKEKTSLLLKHIIENNNIALLKFAPLQYSLEDIFMSAMGNIQLTN